LPGESAYVRVCLRMCWSRTHHTHRTNRKLLTAPQQQHTHLGGAPLEFLRWHGVTMTRALCVASWVTDRFFCSCPPREESEGKESDRQERLCCA
jgi:hypothetical protein